MRPQRTSRTRIWRDNSLERDAFRRRAPAWSRSFAFTTCCFSVFFFNSSAACRRIRSISPSLAAREGVPVFRDGSLLSTCIAFERLLAFSAVFTEGLRGAATDGPPSFVETGGIGDKDDASTDAVSRRRGSVASEGGTPSYGSSLALIPRMTVEARSSGKRTSLSGTGTTCISNDAECRGLPAPDHQAPASPTAAPTANMKAARRNMRPAERRVLPPKRPYCAS